MFRTWLTWGLTSTLLYTACGGGSENELFGNVKPGSGSGGTGKSIEPSIGENAGSPGEPGLPTGGKTSAGSQGAGSSGGESEPPAATGGHDAGSGGASTPGGVPGEPAAGASDPGSAGEGPGGASNGSGGTTGGGASGGNETGGNQTGGNETGGTTGGSETGGTGSGGTTGGTTGGTGTGGTTGGTTGGSATGGAAQGGAGACAVARAQLQKYLNEAQECDPDARTACRSLVSDECECNNVPVGDPISDATSLYLDQLERVRKACGPVYCVNLVCTEVVGHCSPRTEGRGHCVALINGTAAER
jgi:hypothetical protein